MGAALAAAVADADAGEAEARRLRACGTSNSAKAVGSCVDGAKIASVPIGSGAETFDVSSCAGEALVGAWT